MAFNLTTIRLFVMNYRKEEITRLLNTLKDLHCDRQFRGLKNYVRHLKRKKPLNGKQKFILRGASAYLSRLQADRRAKSLGLTEYVPYDERELISQPILGTGDFRTWYRKVSLFSDKL